jgi:TfoX/Sxy family transcriptional regulator of competence genes
MASNADFVQYVVDQCAGAGEITVRQMMGDYCIYCDGVIFGLICDNRLYIKETDAARPVLREQVLGKPYPGARDHFYIEDVDDRDYLADIVKATMPALGKPQAVRNKRVKMLRQYPASLDDVIVPNLVCSQDLRAFFEEHLGKDFRFKVRFQGWLHENAGLTFRDAIEAYQEL